MGPIAWIVDAFVERARIEPRAHVSSGDPIRRHEAGMDAGLWRAFLVYAECRKGLHGEVPAETEALGRLLTDRNASPKEIGDALMLLGAHNAEAMKDGMQEKVIPIIARSLIDRLSAPAAMRTVATSITNPEDIRLVIIDIDGVLTDGTVTYGADGIERQTIHARDELGIGMMIAAGIRVGLVSERDTSVLGLALPETDDLILTLGASDKRRAVTDMQERFGIGIAETVVIGDDAPDVAMLDVAAHAFSPGDAMPVYRDKADIVLVHAGGNGAVREMADMLLAGRTPAGAVEAPRAAERGDDS